MRRETMPSNDARNCRLQRYDGGQRTSGIAHHPRFGAMSKPPRKERRRDPPTRDLIPRWGGC